MLMCDYGKQRECSDELGEEELGFIACRAAHWADLDLFRSAKNNLKHHDVIKSTAAIM